MIIEPECSKRRCKHLLGVLQPTGEERSEVAYCTAFPDGILYRIAYGDDKHLVPAPEQENEIVFESYVDGRE